MVVAELKVSKKGLPAEIIREGDELYLYVKGRRIGKVEYASGPSKYLPKIPYHVAVEPDNLEVLSVFGIPEKERRKYRWRAKISIVGENARETVALLNSKLDEIEREVEKRKNRKFAEEYRNLKHVYVGIGGDTYKLYVAFFDLSEEAKNSKAYNKATKIWEKALDKVWAELPKEDIEKTDIRTPLYNVLFEDGTWGRIPVNHPVVQKAWKLYLESVREKYRKKIEARKEREKRIQKALEEARRTGEPVFIEPIFGFDGDDRRQVELYAPELLPDFGELGWVEIWLVATPEGKLEERAIASY